MALKRIFSVLGIIMLCSMYIQPVTSGVRENSPVDVSRIEKFVEVQIDFGPRIPGSSASKQFGNWLASFIESTNTWRLTVQNFWYKNVSLSNYIITHKSLNSSIPTHLIGAHYDSRARATQGADKNVPIPGANDGASGVAAILELIFLLREKNLPQLGFILFDAEDQGVESGGYGIEAWQWIVGSNYYVDSLTVNETKNIMAFILLDLIGKTNLQLNYELFSNDGLREKIWNEAIGLGYGDIFKKEDGQSIIDDHIPFLRRNVPAVDIIDLNYKYWHTVDDNLENIDYESISIVTDVVHSFLTKELADKSENNITKPLLSSTSSSLKSPEFSANMENFIILALSIFIILSKGRRKKIQVRNREL